MAHEYERRLGRKEAAQFLTERGYRTAPATLAKLACIGGGRRDHRRPRSVIGDADYPAALKEIRGNGIPSGVLAE
jgi:hypothetical protein